MKKRVSALAIVLILVFTFFPVRSFGDDNKYQVNNGELTGYYGNEEHFVIPNSVTSIGATTFNFSNSSLKSVYIPAGVKKIDDYAFLGCNNLERIDVSGANKAFTSINGVLYNKAGTKLIYCPGKVMHISLSAKVNDLGKNSFGDSVSLKAIVVSKGNRKYASFGGALYNNTMTSMVSCPKGITALNTPSSLKVIDNRQFYECSKIKQIQISTGVEAIGEYAFYNCISLENITIPKSVTAMGKNLFNGCRKLKTVTILASIKKLESGVFHSCTSLTDVRLSDSIADLNIYTFYGRKSLKTINIPDSVNRIDYVTFRKCESLESISIPMSVNIIADNAFEDCKKLTIFGVKDSTAHKFALEKGVPFKDISLFE